MVDGAQHSFDFLVIGTGIAGLTFALKAAKAGSVAIITKKQRAESNTNYAQGGIAAVMGRDDSFELHVRDTLEAGAGLCKEDVVRTIVSEGPALVRELIGVGRQVHGRDDRRIATGPSGLPQIRSRTRRRAHAPAACCMRATSRDARSSTLCWRLWRKEPNITVFEEIAGD